MNNTVIKVEKDLSDKDFYLQACEYFYYHAEQRTTMINYFIAVFAACIALYGSLIDEYSLASTLIAVFLFFVSVLFYCIDLRNRFDVKQSQSVIAQIERDYGVHKPYENGGLYAYGVFSNEDNTFKYYGYKKRKKVLESSYSELRKLYKECENPDEPTDAFKKKRAEILNKDKTISEPELMESLKNKSIITLSFSIKMLYYICMLISFLAFILALLITVGVI